jgi:hypothetical protein
MRPIMAAAVAILVAGCTLPSESPPVVPGVVPTADTYTITITKFAGHSNPHLTQGEGYTLPVIERGSDFTYTMKVEGSAVLESDHIGGHFGRENSASPSPTTYPYSCAHVAGTLPNTFDVICPTRAGGEDLPAGLYHIRGHARITPEGKDPVNWWSANLSFRIE